MWAEMNKSWEGEKKKYEIEKKLEKCFLFLNVCLDIN